jgi:DNA polymerase iota
VIPGVARILDPSLRNLPIGITQKSLFATVSYEARALGLRKLQSIRSAREDIAALGGTVVKQGQHGRKGDGEGVELVLVDGEDLSAYRRASAAVAWIVEGIVGAERVKGGKRKRGEVSFGFWVWSVSIEFVCLVLVE